MMQDCDKYLLKTACDRLGRMLDFSVYSLHLDIDKAAELFAASGLASLFEQGDISTIMGMSGIELAYEMLERSGMEYERQTPRHTISLSAEYHIGYCLADFCCSGAAGFEEVLSNVRPSDLVQDYSAAKTKHLSDIPWDASPEERAAALAEFDENYHLHIASYLADKISRARRDSEAPIKKLRIKNGLSQSQLAKASGVPLRTIQQYEQRQKDINRARSEYIIRLSEALHCHPGALLDK